MIPTLPDLWRAYLGVQSDLGNHSRLNDRNWGLEAGLNEILDAIARGEAEIPDPETAIASGARRERNRARLRDIYVVQVEPTFDNSASVDARMRLERIRRILTARNWELAKHVAVDFDYAEIARRIGGTPGGLRIRMLRIRGDLADRAA